MTQPYNCTSPGHLFVGYTRLITEIRESLRNGNSFAVIGGRRCGKTSLLIRLKEILKTDGLNGFEVQPHLFSIQCFETLTTKEIFKYIYAQVTADCSSCPPWPLEILRGAYQSFLHLIDESCETLSDVKGPNWLLVLLIDELDAFVSGLKKDDTFFQNLRNLLMDSRHRRHFRVVASGTTHLDRLISSGSSPLNNLRNKYLRILSPKAARELIEAGFKQDYDEHSLFNLTGRHPYLLQGVLEKVWNRRPNCWDKRSIKAAAEDFLKEHRDFRHWLEHFNAAEKDVYHQLIHAPGVRLSVNELQNRVDPKNRTWVTDAVSVLSYHCVVDDSDPHEPEAVGTMFQDWFKAHTDSKSDSASYGQQEPTIDEISQVVDQLVAVISDFKQSIHGWSIEDGAKHKAKNALDNAVSELTRHNAGEVPEESTVRAALDESAQILKSAGTTTEQLTTFIDKAQNLVRKLGKIASWIVDYVV